MMRLASPQPSAIVRRRRRNTFVDIGFDQDVGLAVGYGARHRPDVQRRMRPGRLSEVFDDAGNVAFALDQQNVTGSKGVA